MWLPEWMKEGANWVVGMVQGKEEEEVDVRYSMSGALRGEDNGSKRWKFDQSVWEAEAEVESVESRIAELGLA